MTEFHGLVIEMDGRVCVQIAPWVLLYCAILMVFAIEMQWTWLLY